MGDVCACEIHESGRGLAPCMGHARRIREHQAMYLALRDIAAGTLNAGDDPSNRADRVLADVGYWHGV